MSTTGQIRKVEDYQNVFTILEVNYFQHITLYPAKPSIKGKIKTFSDMQDLKH